MRRSACPPSADGAKAGDPAALFADVPDELRVWASHGDFVAAAPAGILGRRHQRERADLGDGRHRRARSTRSCFIPEVVHTEHGLEILRNFAYGVCGCTGDWTMASFVDEATARVRAQGGERARRMRAERRRRLDGRGGDHSPRGRQSADVHLRGQRRAAASKKRRRSGKRYERLQLPLVFVDASKLFLDRLAGVIDPEKKRKIIGATFIDVFEAEAAKLGQVDFLAQGTLYPDVIESISIVGQSSMIKSHHNVGGLPERMRMQLIEPLRELFKDEVRAVGRKLGLDEEFVVRQPFPGPGLAVRILGEVTPARHCAAAEGRRDRVGRSEEAPAGTPNCGKASPCCCRCRASA